MFRELLHSIDIETLDRENLSYLLLFSQISDEIFLYYDFHKLSQKYLSSRISEMSFGSLANTAHFLTTNDLPDENNIRRINELNNPFSYHTYNM